MLDLKISETEIDAKKEELLAIISLRDKYNKIYISWLESYYSKVKSNLNINLQDAINCAKIVKELDRQIYILRDDLDVYYACDLCERCGKHLNYQR